MTEAITTRNQTTFGYLNAESEIMASGFLSQSIHDRGREDATEENTSQHPHNIYMEEDTENSVVFESDEHSTTSSTHGDVDSDEIDSTNDNQEDAEPQDDLPGSIHFTPHLALIRELIHQNRGSEPFAAFQERDAHANWPLLQVSNAQPEQFLSLEDLIRPHNTWFPSSLSQDTTTIDHGSSSDLQSNPPRSPAAVPPEVPDDLEEDDLVGLIENPLLFRANGASHSPFRVPQPAEIRRESSISNSPDSSLQEGTVTGLEGSVISSSVETEDSRSSRSTQAGISHSSPLSSPSVPTSFGGGTEWLSGPGEGLIGPFGHSFFFDFLDELADYYSDEDGLHVTDIESDNADFARLCEKLCYTYTADSTKLATIAKFTREIKRWQRPEEVTAESMKHNRWDCQGIPWNQLGVKKETMRKLRNKEYQNYRNIKDIPCSHPERLPENRSFFRFRRQDNMKRVKRVHFQLRNLIGVTSKNDVYYAGNSRIMRTDPCSKASEITMDLTREAGPYGPMKITTMAASYGVCIAGGFYGEYAMKGLNAPFETRYIKGTVTTNNNGITNHVYLHPVRTSRNPYAVFSSNDNMIRVLDCYRNTFIAEHGFEWAVNCSATSPDGRLRAIVGDAKEVLIADSERGMVLQTLHGHNDYGFACAWCDDGYSIATGNQDKTVRIYDARNFSTCVKEIGANLAGVRVVRFSKNGAGRRVLILAEPADYISVVDATTWDGVQTFEHFGEIGGIELTPNGEELFVANTDRHVGGLMEFERVHSDCHNDEDDDVSGYSSTGTDSEAEEDEGPERLRSVSSTDTATSSYKDMVSGNWCLYGSNGNDASQALAANSPLIIPGHSPLKGGSSFTSRFIASDLSNLSLAPSPWLPARNHDNFQENSQDSIFMPGTSALFDEAAEVDDDMSITLDPFGEDTENKVDTPSGRTISATPPIHSEHLLRIGRRKIQRRRSGSADFEGLPSSLYAWRPGKVERRKKRLGTIGMGSLFV